MKVNFSELILHDGKVPPHLLYYMKRLSKAILNYIYEIYGPDEIVKRVSDPFWFQAFNNVIGMDWDSSGSTTIVIYMLKNFASASDFRDLGLATLGGKGSDSRTVIEELRVLQDSGIDVMMLENVSKLGAKIDGVALQDGYKLYIHSIIVSQSGLWTIIQQGMNIEDKLARRYHIHGTEQIRIVRDPHSGIACDRIGIALNLIEDKASEIRSTIVSIVNSSSVQSLLKDVAMVNRMLKGDKGLETWLNSKGIEEGIGIAPLRNQQDLNKLFYKPITNLNRIEKILKKLSEVKPDTFEELLSIKGVGPETIRALALVAAVIYNAQPSFKDPVTHPIDPFLYSYAHGGKDGIPYPIKIQLMQKTIEFLEEALQEAKIEEKMKRKALERLYKFFNEIINVY
uniref:DUF763 domain-containing protein n=1 Tax=Ignisphaera aggregans TaxID=334771 RepID=A0A7J2U2S9_9CREN